MRRFAGSLVAVMGSLLAVAALVLAVRNDIPLPTRVGVLIGGASFCATSVLLLLRLPGNPIGALLGVTGVCMLALMTAEQYALYALRTAPSVPGGLVAVWFSNWIYAPMLAALVVFLPLTFPTGRLLSRRWRPVAWGGAAFLVLAVVTNALLPSSSEVGGRTVGNIFVVPAAEPVLRPLNNLAGLLMAITFVAAVAAIVIRFHRSRGIERQQLKLVATALALTPLPFVTYDVSEELANFLFATVIPLVPISVTVSILRYRLFEIDRLISRTVSYVVLSGLLVGVYVTLVTLVPRLLPTADSVIVAGSTLAVAALFQPARRRVQGVVDRRFNRARYDAERTLELFRSRLRDEVDLESVRAELLTVVRQTVQPAAAAVWLRPGQERAR